MNLYELRALLLKRFNLPKEHAVRRTMRRFTIAEKGVFYFCVGLFMFSGIALLYQVSEAFLVEVPTGGGTLTEGVVGNPRFINPVLALSEADKNLTSLVYSGLVRITEGGEVENNLAESIDISPNHLVYTARIRKDARFHSGLPVMADDVLFTIQKITDPMVKSPRRGDWEGVTISKIDERTVSFTLKAPYAPFIDNLATGILPKEIWKNVTDDEFAFTQFNTLPIGSGPYKVDTVERNNAGIPNYYKLTAVREIGGKSPYIHTLVFKFYPSEDALLNAVSNHDVTSVGGITPDKALAAVGSNSHIISSPLPRVFAVFFNQGQSKVLSDKAVRMALDLATPKEQIVDKVLGGYGTPIDGPLPAGLFSWTGKHSDIPYEVRFKEAEDLLANNGWKKNESTGILEKKIGNATMPLSFSISTGDAPELKSVAGEVMTAWQKLGAEVGIQVYESGDLNQNVIRPRHFDALLFGEVVGRDADVYPFWHSSQRNDPGLNIAMYANSRADKYLSDARSAPDRETMEKNYQLFENEIKQDVPAVFLYTPSYLYIVPKSVQAVALGSLSTAQDRFLGVRNWFIETDRVWKVFIN